ncbi:MAG: FAD-dependent oxidoreductase [Acidimicrobiia bacterium]|nr:FAD-dependent oxidoreductase [Acidimicrobiia bacterium]
MNPVVIVGGGPVGMTAALLLAKFGVPSLILEAANNRDPIGSKALCMQRDVLDVLERVGVGDKLMEEGITWTLGRTYYRNIELFQITFPEVGDNHFPPFVNVGQDRTEHWLEARIRTEPLIELRYGHAVTSLSQNDERVALTVETTSGKTTISAQYAIGADGSRSAIRKLIGAEFPGKSFDDQFLICDIRADLGFANERRFFFDPEWNPDRQVLIHPQADSVWRIDWQVPPDFDVEAEQASGGLDERIRKIVGEGEYDIVWMSVYRFHQRIATKFREGRVFLAGDAAHIVSPFGARGLNSGVQDAENLAWKLAFVLNGWAKDDLLDTYEPERRAAAEENLRITSTTMDFLVPPNEELWESRRRTLEAAVGNPNARQMVDSGQLAEPYDYGDSPLTTPTEADLPVPPGRLMPDGVVLQSEGPVRLRELMGCGFIALSNNGPVLDSKAPPVASLALAEIDRTGVLTDTLQLPVGSTVLIRPDGHVAAVATSREALTAALITAVAG